MEAAVLMLKMVYQIMIKNYINNLKFTWIIAFYMLLCFCFLLVHGAAPFIPMPQLFTVGNITHKMKKWDNYLKVTKLKKEKC